MIQNPFEILERRLDRIEALLEKLLAKSEEPTPTEPKDRLLTVKQLSEYWQCHEQTIMQKKRKGELPFIQHGRKLLFSKNAIDELTKNPIYKS